jgi:hypothetical protein
MENLVQWVLRGREGNRMQHFGEPESAKALCGVKLWTAQVVVVAAEESRAACWPYCTRCVVNLKKTAQKLALEIVSYYLAQGKNWTEDQVEYIEQLQDTHHWITKAIQQAERTHQPLDWAKWIKERQERDAQAALEEVAHV